MDSLSVVSEHWAGRGWQVEKNCGGGEAARALIKNSQTAHKSKTCIHFNPFDVARNLQRHGLTGVPGCGLG
jgi:hypothetical protein